MMKINQPISPHILAQKQQQQYYNNLENNPHDSVNGLRLLTSITDTRIF